MDMTDMDRDQWFMNSTSTSPADINYHGLFNQGSTCYLNSVLQVLYMTGDFREAVESYTWSNPGSECIDQQLKPLFDVLKRNTANTSKITDKLGIDRVYEQRDAAEYCERILTLTSPEASQIFHGELTHRTTCSGCGTEMNADGPFWHLPLELVGWNREHYSVVDGIEEHFRTSYLKGENQMYCDQCDTKSDAAITCVMKRHPEVLMLLLKRFEFDYSYMTYVKNGRVVDVPCTLQIPENQTYELYAVVDHFGDLRGGHYTATIKSQDEERWYNFDDASVTLLGYQPFQVDNVERSQSVYLLFYRKKKNTCAPEIREVFSNGGAPHPATINNDDRWADVDKVTEREQGEEVAEAGDDTPEALPIDGNEETGMKDNVGVGSREVLEGEAEERALSSAGAQLDDTVEDQDNGVRQRLPHNCDYQDDQDEGEITKEEEEGEAEADDQAEKRGLSSAGAQLDDTVEDQDCGSAGTEVDRNLKAEASDRHATPDHRHEKDETNEEGRRVLNIKMGSDGLTELLEKGEKSSTKHLDSHAECQDSEGLDNATKNLGEDQGDEQEVGQDCDLPLVRADEEAREIDVKDASEGKTGADEVTPGRKKLLTKYDLCCFGHSGRVGNNDQNRPGDHQRHKHEAGLDDGLQLDKKLTKYDLCRGLGDNGRVGDSERNRPGEGRGFKQGGSSRLYKRHGQEKEERRDVEGDMEQKTGDDDGRGSNKAIIYGKIIEEEATETPSGVQRSSTTKTIRVKGLE